MVQQPSAPVTDEPSAVQSLIEAGLQVARLIFPMG
jgi:hypothetical protein